MAKKSDNLPEKLTEDQALQLSRINTVDDSDLRALKSFEDALNFAAELNDHPILNVEDVAGTGFRVLDDKEKLVGVPFIFVSWRFNEGTYGGFVSAHVVTEKDEKYILNDGSTGLAKQLVNLTREFKVTGGVRAPHGLRVSEYPTCPSCGVPRPQSQTCSECDDTSERRAEGTTFYIDV